MKRENYETFTLIVLAWAILNLISSSASGQTKMTTMHHNMEIASKHIYLTMMDSMMVQMDKASVNGSVESQFVAQMIPHHEGAIAMAKHQIIFGKNYQMIQLAKSILVEQSSELTQMKLWLSKLYANTDSSNGKFSLGLELSMHKMMSTLPGSTDLNDNDLAFAKVMLPHHQAALDMASLAIKFAKHKEVLGFAKLLTSNEQIEIEQMKAFIHTSHEKTK